ncbi:MAG TPA: hypothetical protein VK003_15890 [Oceanobacillus sp.]|nr:hypothetical protein [Oceanobacillus sp.]
MLPKDADMFDPAAGEKHYWSPTSQDYAPGNALLAALDDGWQVDGVIFRQEFWLTAGRRTNIYHITLIRNGETIKMKMVDNPFITRLIYQLEVQVVRVNERKAIGKERWSVGQF